MTATAAAKVGLGLLTIVLLLSQVGFLAAPVLMPAHVWAARRSGRVGRVAWSVAPAAFLAMGAWALTYVSIGEAQPAIWLVPVLVLVGAGVLVFRLGGAAAVADR